MAIQRQTAESAVRRIKGVKGVTNSMLLKPAVKPTEIKKKIQDAFRRSAELDATGSWSRRTAAK